MNWKAHWIWLDDKADQPNRYVHFRRVFTLPSMQKGGRTQLHVTAGHFYRLYLNGHFIARGPDRCYFRRKVYHSYDVTRLLRKGKNVLAIHVHYLGQRVQNLMERHAEGPAGCLAQLEVDGQPVVWTNRHWKAIEDPAYSSTTEPASMHREWRNEFYASRAIAGWNTVSFDDATWPAAREVAPANGGAWGKLVAKETPEMTSEVLCPLNLYVQNDGGKGPLEYDQFRLYNIISDTPGRLAGDLTIWNDRQDRHELLFDMGRVVAGYPRIEITDSLGGTIQVHYGESLNTSLWDTIHLGKGPLTWSPFTTRGGRYLKLVITGARNPITIRSVRWIRTNYPVAHRGQFQCSDERLNAIWKMCALTAESCAMDHFTDCVGREQVLWMMDFRFQALQHYYYFGDTALARKDFAQYAALQLNNGHILCYGPSCRPKETLMSGEGGLRKAYDWLNFNFYLVIAAWEYYQYTQDKSFLRTIYPVLRRCMEYYAQSERDGFAACGEVEGSNHVDWGYQGYQNSDRTLYSFTQGVYYGAWVSLLAIAEALGRKADASWARKRGRALEQRFFRRFIDPRTHGVADCLVDGQRIHCHCLHPHIALLRFFDHIPEAVRRRSLQALIQRKGHLPRSGIGIALGAEALFRHGQGEAAVSLIRDYYSAIMAAGHPHVPEFFDMDGPRGADVRWSPTYSRCHSYASLGGTLLQQHVLGAFVEGRTVRLSPVFAGLDNASGVVPTPSGDVQVKWTRRPKCIRLTVHAPEGVKVRFEPVDLKERVILSVNGNLKV